MKILLIFVFLLTLMNIETRAQTPKDFAEIWERKHISTLPPSQARHSDLKKYLDKLQSLGLKIVEVGRSFENREIYQIEWGTGATKVLMWSQMHGDEPTATSAVIDLLAFLQMNRDIAWVRELENAVTIRVVPMLNPDGAEVYTRRNAEGIDINRDAVALQTPEGRLLKKLRDEWQPDIGFNLHNQNELTTVAHTKKQAAISLLAVSGSPRRDSYPRLERNKRLCAVMIAALENFIKGHIARYDDDYNPRAFGDRISEWGTPVILVETGALHGRDEMFLTKMNFVAYLAALKSLADKSEARADANVYDKLPFNGSGDVFNFIFRKANVVNQANAGQSFVADIAINLERRRAGEIAPARVEEIGDLSIYEGLDEYDAGDFYVAARSGNLKIDAGEDVLFYKKSRKINWAAKNLSPDAIFSHGKWTKGANLVPKKD